MVNPPWSLHVYVAGVREGKHDELADMSLELIIEAMPAREMFINFCKEQFGCRFTFIGAIMPRY